MSDKKIKYVAYTPDELRRTFTLPNWLGSLPEKVGINANIERHVVTTEITVLKRGG
jgi:hypothetical protein